MTYGSAVKPAEPSPVDLVGVAEISRRLAVPRTTVSMWAQRRATSGFPLPVAEPSMGPVYDFVEVKAWYDSGEGRRTR